MQAIIGKLPLYRIPVRRMGTLDVWCQYLPSVESVSNNQHFKRSSKGGLVLPSSRSLVVDILKHAYVQVVPDVCMLSNTCAKSTSQGLRS